MLEGPSVVSPVAKDVEALEGRRHWWSSALGNPVGMAGALMVGLVIFAALLGPILWRVSPNAQDYVRLRPPSLANPMGTDELGRDIFSRILHGALVTLEVSAAAVLIALVVGMILGMVAGYRGGFVDGVVMRVVDVGFAFPGLILATVITGLLGPSRFNLMIAIGVIYSPAFARVVRGSVLEVLGRGYVEAARALGSRSVGVVYRHILPNIAGPIIVMITVYFSAAILSEAALSFLGFGIQPPEADWGSMLNGSRQFMQLAPGYTIFPGFAIMFAILGFNFLGDGLRDILDPSLRDL